MRHRGRDASNIGLVGRLSTVVAGELAFVTVLGGLTFFLLGRGMFDEISDMARTWREVIHR
jgi:hypothetical protein